MKLRFGRVKLRHRLISLILIAILMMVIVQLFYYIRFQTLIEQKARVYNSNILAQIEEKLESVRDDLKLAATSVSYNNSAQEYLVSDDNARRFELSKYISDVINYVGASNGIISDIRLIDLQGRTIGGGNMVLTLNDIMELEKKYNIQQTKIKKPFFSSISDNKQISYFFIYPVNDTTQNGDVEKRIGSCIIKIKQQYFQDVVDKIKVTGNSRFMVVDDEDHIVACNTKDLVGDSIDPVLAGSLKNNDANPETEYQGRKSLIYYKIIPNIEWKIISITPSKELTQEMVPIRSFGLFICISMTVLLLAVGMLFIRSITGPVSRLIYFMERVGEKNLQQRLDMHEDDEIGQLAGYINKMLDKIEDITRKIVKTQASLYEMELTKKQADLSALQSQINPHFLYNTLECIRGIALVNKISDIVTISTAMAKIFRYSVKADDIVPVKDELECIRDYIGILRIRYKNRFTVEMNIDERILELVTIKMILQPVVENAIYHGLERKNGPGTLVVDGYMPDSHTLCFEISDDGIGIPGDELEKLQYSLINGIDIPRDDTFDKKSVGLANINKRVKLTFGVQFGISIESREKSGTKVFIKLPVLNDFRQAYTKLMHN